MPGTPPVSRSSSPSRLTPIPEAFAKPVPQKQTQPSVVVHTPPQSVRPRELASLHEVTDKITSLFAALDRNAIRPEHLEELKHEFNDLLVDIDSLTGEDRLTQLKNLSTRLEKRREAAPWFIPHAANLVAEHLQPPTWGSNHNLGATWHEPSYGDIVAVQVLGYVDDLPNLALDEPEAAISQGRVVAASISQCPVNAQYPLIEQLRNAVLTTSQVCPPLLELLDYLPSAVVQTSENEDAPS